MLRRHMWRRPPLLLPLMLLLLLDFYSYAGVRLGRSRSRSVVRPWSTVQWSSSAVLSLWSRCAIFVDDGGRPARPSSSFFAHFPTLCHRVICFGACSFKTSFKLKQLRGARWLTSRGTAIGSRDSCCFIFVFFFIFVCISCV